MRLTISTIKTVLQGANPYLPNAIVYDKSQEQDYPSIGQLSAVCKENKMQPIFAVTKEVRGLYEVGLGFPHISFHILMPNVKF